MNGSQLRRIRAHLCLTQVELAKRAGLHGNTVARMERGEMTITPAMARLFQLLAAEKGGKR